MQNLEHRLFNKTKLLLVMLIMSCTTVMAQTFTDHVRKDGNGKATVTITQSADVEKLVNSRPALTEKQKIDEQQAEAAKAAKEAKERKKAKEIINNRPQHSSGTHASTSTNNDADDNDMNIPTVDMRKKMIRNGYKVTGYRVQAFAGRNSKADRIKAESVGNAIKMKYPDQPVYVHFYSPRWICRVGEHVQLWGRIQSREYQKQVGDEEYETRVAYEISVSKLECVEESNEITAACVINEEDKKE